MLYRLLFGCAMVAGALITWTLVFVLTAYVIARFSRPLDEAAQCRAERAQRLADEEQLEALRKWREAHP